MTHWKEKVCPLPRPSSELVVVPLSQQTALFLRHLHNLVDSISGEAAADAAETLRNLAGTYDEPPEGFRTHAQANEAMERLTEVLDAGQGLPGDHFTAQQRVLLHALKELKPPRSRTYWEECRAVATELCESYQLKAHGPLRPSFER